MRSTSGQEFSFYLDISPFILTSSVDPASEVLVVGVLDAEPFVRDLRRALANVHHAPALRVLSEATFDPRDKWIQDATEIGVI